MSLIAPETSLSGSVKSLKNLLLDYQEGVVILRSQDSYEFRVPKLHLIHNSPVLREELLILPNPQPDASVISADPHVGESTVAADAYRLVHLPFNGTILISLLSYIFPVPPILPSTTEEIVELLSVAQMYKMDVVLTHIRNHIVQQEPPLIRKETAFSVYTLAQKGGLRTEALQAARCTLNLSTLIGGIGYISEEDELGSMPGAFLHELWKYHERVRSNLTSDMEELKTLRPELLEILGDNSDCDSLDDSGLPSWLTNYIYNLTEYFEPISLDFTNFHLKFVYHCPALFTKRGEGCGYCFQHISEEALRAIWEILMTVVQGSIARAESDFVVGVEGTRSENDVQTRSSRGAPFLPKHSDMPGADVILQSSDLVNFQVNRSVLATSSPFFKDMFSLPQPSSKTPDQLPVVCVSETAEILDSLISMLYQGHPEIPHSSDNILALLAATDKYDMDVVQSSIKKLLSPTDSSRVFHMYAVACSKMLIPEMEAGARLTLDYPLTFESIGEAMRLFDGGQLLDLFDFRQRCLRKFTSGMELFFDHRNGPSKIWVGCPGRPSNLPRWLGHHKRHYFEPFQSPVQVREKLLNALQRHIDEKDCQFCSKVYTVKGEKYFAEMIDVVEQARNVPLLTLRDVPGIEE